MHPKCTLHHSTTLRTEQYSFHSPTHPPKMVSNSYYHSWTWVAALTTSTTLTGQLKEGSRCKNQTIMKYARDQSLLRELETVICMGRDKGLYKSYKQCQMRFNEVHKLRSMTSKLTSRQPLKCITRIHTQTRPRWIYMTSMFPRQLPSRHHRDCKVLTIWENNLMNKWFIITNGIVKIKDQASQRHYIKTHSNSSSGVILKYILTMEIDFLRSIWVQGQGILCPSKLRNWWLIILRE